MIDGAEGYDVDADMIRPTNSRGREMLGFIVVQMYTTRDPQAR